MIDKLRNFHNRSSTRNNYYQIWKGFNAFILKLDQKLRNWEDRLTLYVGYLINENRKSTTIRSYISAIRAVLQENDIELNENRFLLTSLTRACCLINDHVYTRLPIYSDLLGLIIKKLGKNLHDQPYLRILYCAILAAGYFGLLRIGGIDPESACNTSKRCPNW